MRKYVLFPFAFLPIVCFGQFEKYFEDATLRMDYSHSGRVGVEYFNVENFLKIPHWAGSRQNMTDELGLGVHKIEMIEKSTGKLLFSKGFCSLMEEWLTMPEAKTSCGNFQETFLMPFPKVDVRLLFYTRDDNNQFKLVAEEEFTPSQAEEIDKDEFAKAIDLHIAAEPSKCLDVVIVPAGYTVSEKEKMLSDLKMFSDFLFSKPPFDEAEDKISVRGVEFFSSESGIPGLESSKAEFNELGVHYNTFGSERYIMTEQLWKLHDAIIGIPYDQIVIMCNSNVYGGGGIYNFYATSYVNPQNGFVLIHEFGHSCFGLADEYAENDSPAGMLSATTEPWERNVTTLKNFSNKWEDMIRVTTPCPTPCTEVYKDEVGVFEGAAYQSKGIYRPYQNCLMRSDVPFCPVCTREIQNMLKIYTK